MSRRAKLWVGAALSMGIGVTLLVILAFSERLNFDGYLRPSLPPNNPLSAAYDAEWRPLLLVTPGEIARVVIQPAFDVEAAASISGGGDGGATYRLTCTRATKSIWYSGYTEREKGMKPLEPVPIERKDVTLTREIAVAVQKAWLAMLHLPRRKPPGFGVDGVGFEFSSYDPHRNSNTVGTAWSPQPGRVADMAGIGRLLLDYCVADEAARSQLTREIATRSRTLRWSARIARLTSGWIGPGWIK